MTTLSKDEVIAMATKIGFPFMDVGYGPDVLHTDRMQYSSRWFERLCELARADLIAENEDHIQQLRKEQLTVQKLRDEIAELRLEVISAIGQTQAALEKVDALKADAERLREALKLHMEAYSAAWKPGMEILEPLGDSAMKRGEA